MSVGGIGDGLLMMIAYESAKNAGYAPTLIHENAKIMKPLFPDAQIETWPETFDHYDLVVAQNDNSDRMWRLMKERNLGKFPNLIVFFRTPNINALPCDFIFKPKTPMAKSISEASATLFALDSPSKNNGLAISATKKKKHIAIHPTSKDPKRTWPRKKFITLARNLQQEGYTVSFLVGPDEYAQWQDLSTEFFIPQCASLNDTAKHLATCDYFIGNDSGLGHLASNLHIPTLTIAGNPKQITYWRPAFSPGLVITIPFELPNFKGINFRLRDVFWQNFISVSRVRKAFNKLAHA